MGTSIASEALAIVGEETASRIFANRRSSKAFFAAENSAAFRGRLLDDGLDEVMLVLGQADLNGQRDERDCC